MFHASAGDEVLFGGAAGPGKSMALLVEMFHQAIETPRNEVAIFRRLYPQLQKTHIKWSREGAPGPGSPGKFPARLGTFDQQRKCWTFTNGSRLWFMHSQHEHTIFGHQGAEFGGLAIDEVTEWSSQMYLFARRLVRSTVPGVWPRIRCATNPIGLGYEWVKRRWVQPVLDGKVENDEVWIPSSATAQRDGGLAMSRAYVPATHEDNPLLLVNDPGYLQRLEDLPVTIRNALKKGSWEIVADPGAPFWPEYVMIAHDNDLELEEGRWRCPTCSLRYVGGVLGAAYCVACHRALRPNQYLSTWDLAKKRDWVVGITFDYGEDPVRIVAFDRFKRVPWPEIANRIETRASQYPGTVLIDATGVGDVLGDYLAVPHEAIIFSGPQKTKAVNAAVVALEHKRIVGPRQGASAQRHVYGVNGVERLWAELLQYRWDDKDLVQDCVMAFIMAADWLDSGMPQVR